MNKIDYKKELKHLYSASAKKLEIVEVPRTWSIFRGRSCHCEDTSIYQ